MSKWQNRIDARSAFTLIECLIAMVLIGLAISALVVSNGSTSAANGSALEMSSAEFMIEQFKQITESLPVVDPNTGTSIFGREEAGIAYYDDVDDFNNTAGFSPPLDSNRQAMTDYPGWIEKVTIRNVSDANIIKPVANHASRNYKINVAIVLNGKEIASQSWIRVRQ